MGVTVTFLGGPSLGSDTEVVPRKVLQMLKDWFQEGRVICRETSSVVEKNYHRFCCKGGMGRLGWVFLVNQTGVDGGWREWQK